jgi:hypothetical protein
MSSLLQFVTQDSFKTLPDGKRVFRNIGFSKPTYFLISDTALEDTLRNKVFWINICLLVLGIGAMVVFGYYTGGKFIAPFIFFWWGLSGVIRYLIIKKDVSRLQKLSIKHETIYFYDNFTNKVQVGKNIIPPNYEIVKYLDVPDGDDKILLLSYKDSLLMILRCALGGWIIWQSELKPKFNGTLVNMEWHNEKIRFSSEYAESILLDPNTGSIVDNK